MYDIMSSMDLGQDESSRTLTSDVNNAPTPHDDSSAPNTPQDVAVEGHPPLLDLQQIDLASLPPELRTALHQLDPDRQRRALEMLMVDQLEQQAALAGEQLQQQQQQLPDEHFLTIALNGETE